MARRAAVRELKSPGQGAATTVLAAIGKVWKYKGGRYLEDCAEALRVEDGGAISGPGYVSHTYDPEQETRLWKDSLKIVGLEDDL